MAEIGTVLGGKYRLLARLGEGGMGTVFRAENILSAKHVALKQMHAHFASQPQAAERFIREARAAARVRHPNVVDIYDVVQEPGSTPFLVMELLEGESLREYVLRNPYVHVSDLLALLLPAISAVAAAHDSGVVHRDLKPENIFLARERGVEGPVTKVLDFGIARLVAAEDVRMTQAGAALGTPAYMSIEQLRGDETLDGRADVYAFGVILYEAITNRLPHSGKTISELIIHAATTDPTPVAALRPDLPPRLASCVDRAVARDRGLRWQDLQSLHDELAVFAAPAAYGGGVPRLGRVAREPVLGHTPARRSDDASGPGDTFGARELAGKRSGRGFRAIYLLFALSLVPMYIAVRLMWNAQGETAAPTDAGQLSAQELTQKLASALGSLQTWIQSPVCLVDANGDDLLDVVGFVSHATEKGPVGILDGKSGKMLWSGGRFSHGSTLLCPNTQQFVTNDDKSFVVTLRSARKPELELPLRLSDAPHHWGIGDGCLAIETRDEKKHGFALPDGSPTVCAAQLTIQYELPGSQVWQRPKLPWQGQHAGTTYRMDVRTPGTPVISLSARGANRWQVELPYEAEKPALLFYGDLLVIAARPLDGAERALHVVRVDAQTGRVMYARPLCRRNIGVMHFVANGPYIVLSEGWSGVWTLDAETGGVVWRSGACGN